VAPHQLGCDSAALGVMGDADHQSKAGGSF